VWACGIAGPTDRSANWQGGRRGGGRRCGVASRGDRHAGKIRVRSRSGSELRTGGQREADIRTEPTQAADHLRADPASLPESHAQPCLVEVFVASGPPVPATLLTEDREVRDGDTLPVPRGDGVEEHVVLLVVLITGAVDPEAALGAERPRPSRQVPAEER